MIIKFVVLLSIFLRSVKTDFIRSLSSIDREEFMALNRENKDVTESQLMEKIGEWAKAKGLEKEWSVEQGWKRREKSVMLRHLQNFQFGIVSTFDDIEKSMRNVNLTRQQIEKRVEEIFDTRTGSAVVIRKVMEEHRKSFDFDRQPETKDDIKKHVTLFASFSASFHDLILKRTKRSLSKVPGMIGQLSQSIRDEKATITENSKKYEAMIEKEKDEGVRLAVETIFEMSRSVSREERKREEKNNGEKTKTEKKNTKKSEL